MYEYRATVNYAFGQLGAPASASDTVLTSPDFAQLPGGLLVGFYVPITLGDPATGNYEIVWATGHDEGSTTITVVRGKEGTTAKPWPAVSAWCVAPTNRDVPMAVDSSAIPTDLHVGATVVETNTGKQKTKTWGSGLVAAAGLCLPEDVGKTVANANVPSWATMQMQMGCFFNVATSGGLIPMTFPHPFPNGFIAGFAASIDANVMVGYNGDIRAGSKTGMTVHPVTYNAAEPSAASMFWTAFGW